MAADARESLAQMRDRLLQFASGANTQAMAQSLVPVIRAEAAEAIAQQRSMDGTPWPPTKDGRAALQNAMAAVSVTAEGATVTITVSGVEAYHHFGAGRVPARPIIPTRGLPTKLGNAIRLGIVEMGDAFLNRQGRGDMAGAVPSGLKGGGR